MTKDTAYNLEVQLQRIDEKVTLYAIENTTSPDICIDLNDERAVIKQCLRVCEDAKAYIESLTSRASSLLQKAPQNAAEELIRNAFEAQLATRQALDENRDKFVEIIGRFGQRLESLVLEGEPRNDKDRLRFQEDIDISKQCLEVCKVATELSRQKIYNVGEVIVDNDSDQVVVNTLADLFDVKKAVSTNRSAQLVASLTPENFRDVVEKRYDSRFGAAVRGSSSAEHGTTSPLSVPETQKSEAAFTPPTAHNAHSRGPKPSRSKPSQNEIRKRLTKEDFDE